MALSLQKDSKSVGLEGGILSLTCVCPRWAQRLHTIDAQGIHQDWNPRGCKVTKLPQEEKAIFCYK